MGLMKNKLLLILAILFIGLFLRVYNLGNESIWLDEGFSIRVANLNLSHIISFHDNNPPLYHIILHWWINLFGDSEFSVRFPSVIFGSLAIFMMYMVGNQIFDKDVGILSSLLLGLSVYHIGYSQEARTYSLSVLLTLFSMYFFIKLLKKGEQKNLVGYILSSILLMYSHIYGLFIIISQNVYLIALFLLSKEAYKPSLKRWILIQVILIFLFAPWATTILISQMSNTQSISHIPIPSKMSIIGSFITYSGSQLLLLPFLILSSYAIIVYEKTNGNFDWRNVFKSLEGYCWKIRLLNTGEIYLLLVWLLTPIILPFIISKFSTPIYSTRYTIVASLAFYLLVAKGIRNIRNNHVTSIIISVIIAFSLVGVWEYYTKINKQQWRDVANYIDTNATNADLLLFNPGYYKDSVFDYYSKRADLIKKPFPKEGPHVNEENIKELDPAIKGYKRVWVILPRDPNGDKKGLITSTLNDSYDQLYHMSYKGINLFLFGKKMP